jgi:transcriptional repressor of cell division inhibition gene dicB
MLKKDVLAYFDPGESQPSVTAKRLGLTPGAISQWGDLVPELRAREIAELTKGKLKFRRELYRRERIAS